MNKIKIDDKKKIIIYLLLLVYGCVVSYYLIKATRLANPIGPLEDYYMSLRVTWLNQLIDEFKATGIYTGLHRLYDQNATMYLYLTHISNFLGTGDALHTFFYVQLAMTRACVAFYPVIFYRMSDSIVLAAASVFFFRIFAPYSIYLNNDSYFIHGWLAFLSLPVLFFLFRDKWTKGNWLWVVFLMILMAVGNIFRSSAGLALVVCIIVLMLIKIIIPSFKEKKYRNLAIGLIFCIISLWGQSFFTSTVPHIYQSATNQQEALPVKGPWHALYVGLGWEENPLGLVYSDSFGYMGREHLLNDVSDGYYMCIESPEYMDAVKDAYFEAVFSDPGFFISSYIRKAFTAIKTVYVNSIVNIPILSNGWYYETNLARKLSFVMPVITLIFLGQQFVQDKRKLGMWLVAAAFIAAVNMAVGILPGIIANPLVREYTFGMTATLDCLIMVEYMISVYAVVKAVKHILILVSTKN